MKIKTPSEAILEKELSEAISDDTQLQSRYAEEPTEEEILEDCKRLLINILHHYPDKDYIDTEIANILPFNQEVIGSKYRSTQIFIYKYPATVLKLKAEGVFQKITPVYTSRTNYDEWNYTEEILEEALTQGKEQLTEGVYYDDKLPGHFKVHLAKQSPELWLGNHGYYSKNPAQYFGFYNKVFKLQRIDGTFAIINFYPKGGEGLNPYYLLYAFHDILKQKWERDGMWVRTIATLEEIRERLNKQKYPKMEEVDKTWIRYTKGNLKKKIPLEYVDLIEIGYFDYKESGHPFGLKIPF